MVDTARDTELAWMRRTAYRAGWTRVAFGGIAVVLGPLVLTSRAVPLLYIASALTIQLLIRRNIGGELRALIGGLIDVALISYVVQRTGSASTLLVALYVYLGMLMALIHTRRVAGAIAALASATYIAVLALEVAGVLRYAPDAPAWSTRSAPQLPGVILAGALVSVLMTVTTLVVGQQAHALRAREGELLKANARLEELSQRDPLTRLYNRRHLLERLDHELARVRRGGGAAVLMLDLDGFKRVNDERGHLIGDDLLQRIAAAISGAVREVDLAGRYGGDEFVVVLASGDPKSALAAGERLCREVRAVGLSFDPERPVTASVGVALARADDDSRRIVTRADDNVYRAKQLGGDRAVAGDSEGETPERASSRPGAPTKSEPRATSPQSEPRVTAGVRKTSEDA